MSKQPQDHLAKQPTKAEITKAQEAALVEQKNQQEFIAKYNALCDEYGYYISPQIGVQLTKKGNQ